MKKLLLSIATIYLLSSPVLLAQNTAPYWSLAGNSNATATSKLGTTNDISLRFYTNNVQRMIINSTLGNVGIGDNVTSTNATRVLNLVDANAVMRIIRVHATNAPAVELLSRTSANGDNKAYWDFYAQPSDASFRIRDRLVTSGAGNDRLTILHSNGNVGIGTATPARKLDVNGDGNFSGALSAGSSSTLIGVYGVGSSYGVYGNGSTYGTYGYSSDGDGATGFSFDGIGVVGKSTDMDGGNFYSTNGYGMRAGTGNSTGNWAGVFDGNVYSFGAYQTSDKNLKKNINEFTDAMSIINKLKPKNYEFRNDEKYASLNLPKGTHYGLIAQDLQEVLPNVVSEVKQQPGRIKAITAIKPTAEGKPSPLVIEPKEIIESINIKAVNYVELIPIMIKAMQEQDATIQSQNSKIEALTQLVNKLSVKPSAKLTSASLGQSIPNPNSTSTRIAYSIPTGFSKAELIINNEAGQKVKQIQLTKSGLIDINTSRLSAGTYFYTLFVNGTSVDTKKMVVAR